MRKIVKVLGYGTVTVFTKVGYRVIDVQSDLPGGSGFHFDLFPEESKALRKALKAAERAHRGADDPKAPC